MDAFLAFCRFAALFNMALQRTVYLPRFSDTNYNILLQSLHKVSLTILAFFLYVASANTAFAIDEQYSNQGVHLQILGSGGPEVGDQRASSSYLVWLDGKARVLIDVGGGSSVNFGHSDAQMEDLDAILFSHFHVDHSAGLPALIKSSFFDERQRDLPVFGPSGNPWMPDTEDFLESLFGIEGAFRYLSAFVDDGRGNGYRLMPTVLDVDKRSLQSVLKTSASRLAPLRYTTVPCPRWPGV